MSDQVLTEAETDDLRRFSRVEIDRVYDRFVDSDQYGVVYDAVLRSLGVTIEQVEADEDLDDRVTDLVDDLFFGAVRVACGTWPT